ncbi:MAG: hypothetical protein IKL10_01930 [Clostridia bacterium]|nr:hypothetical protein [Clostridia bacterium]
MADCPKCKQHLKLTDWKQNCPHCGANIVVYDLQERLMKEADKAEVQYYHFQKNIDRIKTAFVGSKLSIVRIFTSLIPIAALFLPLIKVTFSAPLVPFEGNLGVIEIYNMFEKLDLGVFANLLSDEATRVPAIFLVGAIAFLLLSVVFMLVHFVCIIFACFPKGKKRNYTLDIIFIALVILSMASFMLMPENTFADGTLSFGPFIYLALVILNFVIDILVFRENIEIKHAQCYVGGIPIEEYFEMVEKGVSPEELRAEMYRRLTAIQERQEAELRDKNEKKEAELNG